MSDVFYNNETKLKELTVGQLKDIIVETLNSGLLTHFEPERRQYKYTPIYVKPPYPDPTTTPYCDSSDKSVSC